MVFNRRSIASVAAAIALFGQACGSDVPQAEPDEEQSGGTLTVFDTTRDAFARPAPNLEGDRLSHFFVGDSFFKDNWVIAPASTITRDGLGPTFNARACASCHFKDGRGRPPNGPEEDLVQILIRLSIAGADAQGRPLPDPNYGDQFNPQAIPHVSSEGTARISWEETTENYDDGTEYSLRRPHIRFAELSFGDLADDVLLSLRVAPGVFGVGLLEAVPETTLRTFADPDDDNNDGISGRVNEVWDVAANRTVVGRFGWKANQPHLHQQNAAAFLGDIGITSPLFPIENCPSAQPDCQDAITGGEPEIDEKLLGRVTFYTQTLAVPARRDWEEPEVLRGKGLFHDGGCHQCHVSTLVTAASADVPELENQTIRPYTDLLLHDMGDGLADGRPDFLASGSEWRTPPLWGIGLVSAVNRHTNFLHDGRARNIAEAILWHGGEAQASRDFFRALPESERNALLRFLESL